MKLNDFDYFLPEELIAQEATEKRDHSRLLVYDINKKTIEDKKFYNLLDYLWENDVLVLNKTKVINARLFGKSDSNIKVEVFLHKQISSNTWDCLVYPGRRLKVWKKIKFFLDNKEVLQAEIIEQTKTWRIIKFNKSWEDFLNIIEKLGELPLPPYIHKKLEDKNRYQTVWAEKQGSVAAPTASLHFTQDLLEKLKAKWVKIEKVLLHVWLGTFSPVLTENIEEHQMHYEYIELEKQVAERLNNYKKSKKNIIAVWTTTIRVLETMSDKNWFLSYWKKQTNIFIYPWYKWKFVDNIITNFHLPKSTLLMLVASFIGKENLDKIYSYAISKKYRFFSFWDAMFLRK